MMVQLNTGRNVKHIIAILLISSFITVSAATPEPGLIPKGAIPSDVIVIIPESIEPEIAVTIPKLTPEECKKAAYQLKSLSAVVEQTDIKMFGLRRAMDELHEKGIDTLLVYSGLNPEVLNQNLNLFWQLTVQHDDYSRQRIKAYDGREIAYEKLTTSCQYKPEGNS